MDRSFTLEIFAVGQNVYLGIYIKRYESFNCNYIGIGVKSQ